MRVDSTAERGAGAGRAASRPSKRLGLQAQARRQFLRFFPGGFNDGRYLDWERGYKAEAHARWQSELGRAQFRALLKAGRFQEIAASAIRIEAKTNLLFSFEKMALRDATRTPSGAQRMTEGLYEFLHGVGRAEQRFADWCDVVANLPRRQTRVLTWPVVTVFAFIAQPECHLFLKPNVTREAALRYGFDFPYESRPNWRTYKALLDFAAIVRDDLRDLGPRDMIDLQSFLWVLGSDEYRGRTFHAAQTIRIRRP